MRRALHATLLALASMAIVVPVVAQFGGGPGGGPGGPPMEPESEPFVDEALEEEDAAEGAEASETYEPVEDEAVSMSDSGCPRCGPTARDTWGH